MSRNKNIKSQRHLDGDKAAMTMLGDLPLGLVQSIFAAPEQVVE